MVVVLVPARCGVVLLAASAPGLVRCRALVATWFRDVVCDRCVLPLLLLLLLLLLRVVRVLLRFGASCGRVPRQTARPGLGFLVWAGRVLGELRGRKRCEGKARR